jgi:hypothetical protein
MYFSVKSATLNEGTLYDNAEPLNDGTFFYDNAQYIQSILVNDRRVTGITADDKGQAIKLCLLPERDVNQSPICITGEIGDVSDSIGAFLRQSSPTNLFLVQKEQADTPRILYGRYGHAGITKTGHYIGDALGNCTPIENVSYDYICDKKLLLCEGRGRIAFSKSQGINALTIFRKA